MQKYLHQRSVCSTTKTLKIMKWYYVIIVDAPTLQVLKPKLDGGSGSLV